MHVLIKLLTDAGPDGASRVKPRKIAGKARDEALRQFGILLHDGNYRSDVDVGVLVMPAVEIGDHGDGRVTDLGLACEFGLRHVGHADDVTPPAPIEV